MLNALLLMALFGLTSWMITEVLNRDERKRISAGDASGLKGRYLPSTKIFLTIIIGAAAGLLILLVVEGRSSNSYSLDDGNEWGCSGSMRC